MATSSSASDVVQGTSLSTPDEMVDILHNYNDLCVEVSELGKQIRRDKVYMNELSLVVQGNEEQLKEKRAALEFVRTKLQTMALRPAVALDPQTPQKKPDAEQDGPTPPPERKQPSEASDARPSKYARVEPPPSALPTTFPCALIRSSAISLDSQSASLRRRHRD